MVGTRVGSRRVSVSESDSELVGEALRRRVGPVSREEQEEVGDSGASLVETSSYWDGAGMVRFEWRSKRGSWESRLVIINEKWRSLVFYLCNDRG